MSFSKWGWEMKSDFLFSLNFWNSRYPKLNFILDFFYFLNSLWFWKLEVLEIRVCWNLSYLNFLIRIFWIIEIKAGWELNIPVFLFFGVLKWFSVYFIAFDDLNFSEVFAFLVEVNLVEIPLFWHPTSFTMFMKFNRHFFWFNDFSLKFRIFEIVEFLNFWYNWVVQNFDLMDIAYSGGIFFFFHFRAQN